MSVARQEQREHRMNKAEYLESVEQQWEQIHEGPKPETGLERVRVPVRKEVCEDVKLKNRERGLVVVADGTSSYEGWLAPREAAIVMFERLGEELDRGIENIVAEALSNGEDPRPAVEKYIGTQFGAAVHEAHARVQAAAVRFGVSRTATTLSVTKVVEMVDQNGTPEQWAFLANVGDSRIYLERNGQLRQLTRDDSKLNKLVDEGKLTQEQARQIDQMSSRKDLPDTLKGYMRSRHQITKQIGLGELGDVNVMSITVKPGDRLVAVSDGISDMQKERRIQEQLGDFQNDDEAELALQQESIDLSLKGEDPRAKADDAAAVVWTIAEHGPDRGYLHPDARKERDMEAIRAREEKMHLGYEKARDKLAAVQLRLMGMGEESLLRDRLMNQVEEQEAYEAMYAYGYHLEQARMELLDDEIPPRKRTGETVTVMQEGSNPPIPEPGTWRVVSYDPRAKTYQVHAGAGKTRTVDRFSVDAQDRELEVREGDRLMVEQSGLIEHDYQVRKVQAGFVELIKETQEKVKRHRMTLADARGYMHMRLAQGARAHQRMEHAQTRYQEVLKKKQDLQTRYAQVIAMEAANDQSVRAREQFRLREEVRKMEQLVSEHAALEQRRLQGALPRKDEMRRKQLAFWVYGNNNTPPLSQKIAEKRAQLEQGV